MRMAALYEDHTNDIAGFIIEYLRDNEIWVPINQRIGSGKLSNPSQEAQELILKHRPYGHPSWNIHIKIYDSGRISLSHRFVGVGDIAHALRPGGYYTEETNIHDPGSMPKILCFVKHFLAFNG